MEPTMEELQQENQELREQIQQLEDELKEYKDIRYKQLHDQWAGNNKGRGIR